MTIWKNTCGESWQDTIENGWEVSGKPGAFLFFIPKGALTHHLLKQAVVALPLVGHVRSPRGIAALLREPLDDATARSALLSLSTQMARCFHIGSPFLICLRKPDTGSFAADTGVERFGSTPDSGASLFTTYLLESCTPYHGAYLYGRRAAAFHSSPSERMVDNGNLSFGG